jgi:hypothetical protein
MRNKHTEIATSLILNEVAELRFNDELFFTVSDENTIIKKAKWNAQKMLLNKCACNDCIEVAYRIHLINNKHE